MVMLFTAIDEARFLIVLRPSRDDAEIFQKFERPYTVEMEAWTCTALSSLKMAAALRNGVPYGVARRSCAARVV